MGPCFKQTKQNPVPVQWEDVLSLSICTWLSRGYRTGRDGGSWSILLLLCGPQLFSVHSSCLSLFTSQWDLPRTPAELSILPSPPLRNGFWLAGPRCTDFWKHHTPLWRGRIWCPNCFLNTKWQRSRKSLPACLFYFNILKWSTAHAEKTYRVLHGFVN